LNNKLDKHTQSVGRAQAPIAVVIAAIAFSVLAAPASAASITTCQLLRGSTALRLPSKAQPCDTVTTVKTSVSKVTGTGKKKKTVWSWGTPTVALPAGCTLAAGPSAKKCKLVRAATERAVLHKADPVRFSATGNFSTAEENLPTDVKSFTIGSVTFTELCDYDNSDRLRVRLIASSPLAARATSSGITYTESAYNHSGGKLPTGGATEVQAMSSIITPSNPGDSASRSILDKGLVVTPSGLGGDGLAMFTYIVDVGPATITINTAVSVHSPAYYYEEGKATCTVTGSAFTTLDS
jgi:hypothetical protein